MIAYPYTDGAPVRFTLSDTPVWDGYAHGSMWNGFDNVYVTPAVHADIVAYLLSTVPPGADPSDDVSGIDTIEPFTRDGATYYLLGWGFVTVIMPSCPDCGQDESRHLTRDEWDGDTRDGLGCAYTDGTRAY